MLRTLSLVLFACLALAGCTRSADPLDWKIEADDINELQGWFDRNLALMPDDLAREVLLSVNNIRASTHAGSLADPIAKANHLAHRLNGHTIRSVLIDGNEAGVRMLEARIQNGYDALQSMAKADDNLSGEQRVQWQAQGKRLRDYQDTMKQTLEKAYRRLAELRASPAK